MRRGSVLDILEDRLPLLSVRYGVQSLHLFGSVARDDAGADSDVDFLVRLDRPTFDRFVGLKFDLEDMLGVRVDLVHPDTLPPNLRPQIEREAVQLV